MAEVFAGFVAGYGLALLTTPLLAVSLLRLRSNSALLASLLPSQSNVVAISVVLHGLLTITLTAVGILLGLILLAMEDGDGALGSRNGPFTLFVAAVILAAAAPVLVLARPIRRFIMGYCLLVLVIFGWLLPYLAEWSSFD